MPARRDPRWTPSPVNAPPALLPWLIDRGSLTARLRACCPGLTVRVLAQGAARPTRDERRAIGLRPGNAALCREVLLLCAGRPVVFAHSVLDRRDLDGPWRYLAGLGNRPLGEALFSDPRVCRTPLAFRRLGPGHELYARAARALAPPAPALWARRSLFRLLGRPLLVTEVFLPGIVTL